MNVFGVQVQESKAWHQIQIQCIEVSIHNGFSALSSCTGAKIQEQVVDNDYND